MLTEKINVKGNDPIEGVYVNDFAPERKSISLGLT